MIMNVTNFNDIHQDSNLFHNRNSYFYKRLDWILPITFEIILIAASSWILISLIHFGINTGKWNYTGRRNSEKLNVGHTFTSVIISAIGCIVHPLLGIAYLSVGFNGEDSLCEGLGDLVTGAYGFVSLSLFMFLWLRQRAFFINQMLNIKYDKSVRYFSAVSIVAIYVAGGAVFLFLVVPYNQKSGQNGCLYSPSNELQIGYWVSSFVYAFFGEVSLAGLLLYAVIRSGKDITFKNTFRTCLVETFGTCCPSCLDDEEVSQEENGTERRNSTRTRSVSTTSLADDPDIVRKILIKTLAVSVMTIILGFLFQAYVFYIADRNTHRRFSIIYGSAHLFLQLLLVILTFVNVKQMLFSFRVRHVRGRTYDFSAHRPRIAS